MANGVGSRPAGAPITRKCRDCWVSRWTSPSASAPKPQAAQDRADLYHMTRVSLLGQLSASIAHQLNQPLASILGNAEAAQKMLEREPLDVQELRGVCADIAAEDQRAAQVIRRLGVLFKRGESVFEPLDANELVRDTIEFTRSVLATRHVTFSTQFEPGATISGDRVQLQQTAAEPDDQRR